MRKKLGLWLAVSAMALGMVSTAEAVTISLVPNANSVPVGGLLAVDVVASDLGGSAVAAFDVNVDFDPSVVTFESIVFGTGLDLGTFGSSTDVDAETVGQVNVYELSFELTEDLETLQPDGAFTLFTVLFKGFGAGANGLISVSPLSIASAAGDAMAAVARSPISVGVTPVPLPAAAWLLMSGLVGVARFSRSRRH